MINFKEKSRLEVFVVDATTGKYIGNWEHVYVPDVIGATIRLSIDGSPDPLVFKLVGFQTTFDGRPTKPGEFGDFSIFQSRDARLELMVERIEGEAFPKQAELA